jgi:hypothetical protein
MRYASALELTPATARSAARPARHAATAECHPLLRLQRTAGNAAVQRLVKAHQEAAVQRQTARQAERDAALEHRVSDAVSTEDWDGLIGVLSGVDEKAMTHHVFNLSGPQLRYFHDAIRRAHQNSTMLGAIVRAGLSLDASRRGIDRDSAQAGAAYGTIEGKATKVTDGKIVPAGNNQSASYRFEITFTPNTKVVTSTLIEFIQMARVVSTLNTAPDPTGVQVGVNAGANGPNRQTATHSRIDRVTGRSQGWIGVGNAGQPTPGHLRAWTPGSKQPAWMEDTPSRSVPNVDFTFETAAVSRSGPDAGTVYATVTWGFTIDANMKIIPKNEVYFNKQSKEFDLAVIFWNTEAARTGSTQQPLPTNLH